MVNQISIIGFGWLGLPLANALLKNGCVVKGSTTSDQKLKELRSQKYDAFKVFLSEGSVEGDIAKCLEGSDILILNTPPGLRRNPQSDYVAKIQKLIPFIEASTIKRILFIGSTSVFNEEEDFPVIKNVTLPNALSNSGTQLYKVEQLLQNNPHFETTILRFAGLVDGRRHPAKMMSKRKAIPNPKGPVNLIHREDCVGVIEAIIKQNQWGKVFNAAYPLHPEKEKYYTEICSLKNLDKPDFSFQNISLGKFIDGKETSKALEYNYKHSIMND